MKNINSHQFKTEFKKLSQLDRIEMRQRLDRNKINALPFVIIFLFGLVFASFAFTLAFLGAPHYGDEWFLVFYNVFKITFFFSILWMVASFLLILLDFLFKSDTKKEITKEYFPKLYGDKK
jgi:uncharacterized membrane protein